MPANLFNQNISNTYRGLLHVQGEALPASSQVIVTDGAGQISSIAVGLANQGITVTGTTNLADVNASYATVSGITVSTDTGVVSPNTPKAWAIFSGNDGTLRAGYNVDSISTSVPGEYEITFKNALSSEDYAVQTNLAFDNVGSGSPFMVCSHVMSVPTPTTASFKMRTYKLVGTTPTQFQPTTVSVTIYHA